MYLPIVVPCMNEEEGISTFVKRLSAAMAPCAQRGEIIHVDDGSTDATWEAKAGDLSEAVRAHALPKAAALKNGGDALWSLRTSFVSVLLHSTVTRIAQIHASVLAANARKRVPAKA